MKRRNMIKPSNLLISFLLSFGYVSSASADGFFGSLSKQIQDIANGTSIRAPVGNRIHVVNATTASVIFRVRGVGSAWQVDRLQSKEGSTYQCGNCEEFELELTTSNAPPLLQRLPAGNNYKIIWDGEKSRFGVAAP